MRISNIVGIEDGGLNNVTAKVAGETTGPSWMGSRRDGRIPIGAGKKYEFILMWSSAISRALFDHVLTPPEEIQHAGTSSSRLRLCVLKTPGVTEDGHAQTDHLASVADD